MTVELWCLVAIALWTIVLNYLPLFGRLPETGMAWGFGNREQPPKGKPWVQRADRAHANHLENLPVFAALILVGHVAGRHDHHATAIAAEIFVAARLAHALFYVAGVKVVRTLVFWASLGAELVLLYKLAF